MPPSSGSHGPASPIRLWAKKALISKSKEGGETQEIRAVVSVTYTTRGASGASGARGVVYQDLIRRSWELDKMNEQSGLIERLFCRGYVKEKGRGG